MSYRSMMGPCQHDHKWQICNKKAWDRSSNETKSQKLHKDRHACCYVHKTLSNQILVSLGPFLHGGTQFAMSRCVTFCKFSFLYPPMLHAADSYASWYRQYTCRWASLSLSLSPMSSSWILNIWGDVYMLISCITKIRSFISFCLYVSLLLSEDKHLKRKTSFTDGRKMHNRFFYWKKMSLLSQKWVHPPTFV